MRLYHHPLSSNSRRVVMTAILLEVRLELYPAEARARADVNRWLFWSAYHFTPAVGVISRERISKRMVTLSRSAEPDPQEIARDAWKQSAFNG